MPGRVFCDPMRPMKTSRIKPVLLSALLLLMACCASGTHPLVRPEAFGAKTKVAILGFQSRPVGGESQGLIPLTDIDSAYAAFTQGFAGNARFELVPAEAFRQCPDYLQFPKLPASESSSPRGLERIQVTQSSTVGLARCVGADLIVVVNARPWLDVTPDTFTVSPWGVSTVLEVQAFDNRGVRIWYDHVRASSETRMGERGVQPSPPLVEQAALSALNQASLEVMQRFNDELAAPHAVAQDTK